METCFYSQVHVLEGEEPNFWRVRLTKPHENRAARPSGHPARLDGVPVVQKRVPLGDLYRFFKTFCLDDPVPCDRFLGFWKRTVS